MQETPTNRYIGDSYKRRHPNWHAEKSPWKARKVVRLAQKSMLQPIRVAEIGCGAGGVVASVAQAFDASGYGYDISPQAIDMAMLHHPEIQFRLGDVQTAGRDGPFDLVLLIDVIEHVEDYFGLLRQVKAIARAIILHIPLDLSVQTVLRAEPLARVREVVGHIHYFTKESALATLVDAGLNVRDWEFTCHGTELPPANTWQRFARIPRMAFQAISMDLSARILGGCSLMVLTVPVK